MQSGEAPAVAPSARPLWQPALGFLGASPLLFGAIAALAWLAFAIGVRPLSLPEEGRYVGVAWEMLTSGNWLVPTLDGLPFFHKPPLFYWLAAASMQIFGTYPAAARLVPLLGAAVGAFAVYRIGRHWAGEHVARWTVLVLVTTPFFFAGAQFANLDMLVAGFMAATVVLAAHAALLMRALQPHRAALLGAWAAAALGVLAKGLIGIVLPGLVLVVWLLATRQARSILRLLSPAGVVLFLVIAAPWFVAMQLEYPAFAHYFFVYQHFERFAAGGFNNVHPWWFYVALLAAAALPWSPWLLRSTLARRDGESAEAALWRQLMWAWLIVVVVFFSIPKSKPPGYVMAVLFPLAALAADAVVRARHDGGTAWRKAATASVAIAVAVCVAAVAWSALRTERDNTVLARTLLQLRGPGDPVVFVREYFYDVAIHARLVDPIPVIGDWRDPAIKERDNWRRELAEAAPFAAAAATRVLVDADSGFALRCAGRPLWVMTRGDTDGGVAVLPGATRVATSNQVVLWRVPAAHCAGRDASAPTKP